MNKVESKARLLGRWVSVGADSAEQVTVEFCDDGKLNYEIESNGRRQIILLEYDIDGEWLITNQPSHPRLERTHYEFATSDDLRLRLGSEETCYKRLKYG